MPELRDCVVLVGPELQPRHCRRFAWVADTITAIETGESASALDHGTRVIMPSLVNGHTHLGDIALPDGATGLTLEEAFFRPAGYKYRELAKLSPEQHLPHVEGHLAYLARCGITAHLDFREQGVAGARLLRQASERSGVRSVILSQFDRPPFADIDLAENQAPLTAAARDELASILEISDGFSESTMNDLTDPAWREVREITQTRGRLRAIHCLESPAYRDTSLARTGRGDLARALDLYDPDLVVHLTCANAEEIALLARSGKPAAINPRANAALGLNLPPVSALLAAGVPLLLGTDNGMLNSPNLFPELDFTWKLARSQGGDPRRPDPAEILRMATVNAATILGKDDPGQLQAGLPANFCVLDFTARHLAASRHLVASIVGRVTPADILATYRHGRALWTSPGFAL